jgi:diguanylate cyclase
VGADEAIALRVGETIRRAINASFVQSGETRQRLSVSIGGATSRRAGDFAEMFRAADERLYDAKRQGRNSIVLQAMDMFPRAASA